MGAPGQHVTTTALGVLVVGILAVVVLGTFASGAPSALAEASGNTPQFESDDEANQTAQTDDSDENITEAPVEPRLVPVGVTATNLTVGAAHADLLEDSISLSLGVDKDAITVEPGGGTGTVEIRARNVTVDELREALQAGGVDSPGEVRRGVTAETLAELRKTVHARYGETRPVISQAEFEELQAEQEDDAFGRSTVWLREPAAMTGEFAIVARTPMEREMVLTNEDIEAVGDVGTVGGETVVNVTLTESGTASFAEEMERLGFLEVGVDACDGGTETNDANTNDENTNDANSTTETNDTDYCLVTILDGERISSSGLRGDVAERIEAGTFEEKRAFAVQTPEPLPLEYGLEAGELPVQVDTVQLVFGDPATESAMGESEQNPPDEDGTGEESDNGYQPPPLPEESMDSLPDDDGAGFTLLIGGVALGVSLWLARARG